MLSCDCGYDNDSDWWWWEPSDFTVLDTKRGRRCKSCNTIIKVGLLSLEFRREKYADNEIEYRIYGDNEIPIASWFLCEKCGEIYLNLSAIGYCLQPDENMREALLEYHDITGFRHEKQVDRSVQAEKERPEQKTGAASEE